MLMNIGVGGCKKRKRGDRVFKFQTFCEPGHPVYFDGPFHRNIRGLLEFGCLHTGFTGVQSWSFQLEFHRHPPVHVSLFVVEEPIEMSLDRHCDHCRCVGWGHHMICNRKFHFVLPSKETMVETNGSSCERGIKPTEPKTKLNWVQLPGHLMHGVMHSNGFGHLLHINGIETGSEFTTGYQIMDFWDRICTALRARKVSLNDIAKKRTMDLRLIQGIAYGEPWFGRWGYRFGRGSYGVTRQMHNKAIQALQGMPLFLIVHHFSVLNQEIPIIIARYQTISGHSLQTLGQLFHFMLELRGKLPQESPIPITTDLQGVMAETACRWSSKRVEMAIRVIVEALRKAEFKWVSRQEVRDAARAYIGDTGLLDFVLKSLGNHIVGDYVVRRTLNPVTKVLEYCLEDISNVFPNHQGLSPTDAKTMAVLNVTRVQLIKDMYHLYKYILKEPRSSSIPSIFSAIPTAVRIILDTKHLIKDYIEELPFKPKVGDEETLKFSCTVWLRNEQERNEATKALPPHELITLPAHSTIEELKKEVERNFRDTYWCLQSFVAESIVEVNCEDSDLVYGLIKSGSNLVIMGSTTEKVINNNEIYEGEADNWIVDCPCGAKEDDGEPMTACDICEVRQHIRCVWASEDVPQIFLCSQCDHNIVVFPSLV